MDTFFQNTLIKCILFLCLAAAGILSIRRARKLKIYKNGKFIYYHTKIQFYFFGFIFLVGALYVLFYLIKEF